MSRDRHTRAIERDTDSSPEERALAWMRVNGLSITDIRQICIAHYCGRGVNVQARCPALWAEVQKHSYFEIAEDCVRRILKSWPEDHILSYFAALHGGHIEPPCDCDDHIAGLDPYCVLHGDKVF